MFPVETYLLYVPEIYAEPIKIPSETNYRWRNKRCETTASWGCCNEQFVPVMQHEIDVLMI